ncbi:23S rRNA (uracil(1939)-C(5))-methyltransferase RlmD [Peptoniphilus sp. KCTC 25270]|uniref:23S rRNA (uracil(1939)-C(5))-methyltransferase RlmD n=1 Tax=Peptoniphilus sp. KCTC 25270 TaxID=2897414 RepID=UPI001E4445F6|nr:23S rRNA (uracil(1939)-C(5))-methyltransferase RlmD [Peptoniphilus sp. KCTC 25270]MCD1146535.1 23S rRNA (uracil(1939)-C(5))-methyltransferase RlmD [Peptoniphilus sp. KCTC 25270]
MMEIMDLVELEIIDYDHRGRGLGKVEGAVVFLDSGFIGDRVEAQITKKKKRFFEGKVLKILEKSKDREKNPCPYGHRCGGCAFLGWSYEKELEWKKNFVKNAIQRIGNIEGDVENTLGMENPTHYRNHMQFHKTGDGWGLYTKDSAEIIPIGNCLMQRERANEILEKLQGKKYNREMKLLGLRTNEVGEIMAIFVGEKTLKESTKHKLVADAIEFGIDSLYYSENRNPKFHYGKEFIHLYGKEVLKEQFQGFEYEISPGSFFQVNLHQAEELAKKVVEGMGEEKWNYAMDLFCGIGTLTLPISQKSKETIGIEINPQAIEDARRTAKKNGEEIRYIAGRVEKILPRLLEEENIQPEIAVFDPPRGGVEEEALEAITESAPERILYVSCNPTTLARDLKYLGEEYEIEKIWLVDMFPRSGHVETVVLMSRK